MQSTSFNYPTSINPTHRDPSDEATAFIPEEPPAPAALSRFFMQAGNEKTLIALKIAVVLALAGMGLAITGAIVENSSAGVAVDSLLIVGKRMTGAGGCMLALSFLIAVGALVINRIFGTPPEMDDVPVWTA